MGVHGLWELLAPVGRRVSVETLAGKKLAIDASIWMIQFMKAMRDEKGEMIRNAHILGFFRRICKLLFLRTKPVFVFDGGTPALKRRTVIARRRQRENAQTKIRKTAEKLLLNHLKTMRLKEMAEDLEKQRQNNDVKGKKAIIEEPNRGQNTEKGNAEAAMSFNQVELDAMLAASLAAEESEGFHGDASTSGAGVAQEVFGDEDEDEDEEMILPEMHGKVDPAILASLPPSMQLDLLVQMRERLMAENRQKYQKVKKAPARFSELQIQSYLKTVAFRREIDGVQKSAAGRGIGGVQTSRIASEANREFIFSSSFSGDKQAFISGGQERTDACQSQPAPVNSTSNVVTNVTPTKRSGAAAGLTQPETVEEFNDDVETYLDERGRVRVSRVRALGIRMTRDLQRNLDLMKEREQEKAEMHQRNTERTGVRNLADFLVNSSKRIRHQEVTDQNNDELNDVVDTTEEQPVIKGTSIEVSFEDVCDLRSGNEDDNFFASLVAGDPVMDLSLDNYSSPKQILHSDSDCEWEEGVIEDEVKEHPPEGVAFDQDQGDVEWEEEYPDARLEVTSYRDELNGNDDESEVEWEEEHQNSRTKSISYPDENRENVSKGAQEEEATFQEAIRRSLEDGMGHKSVNEPPRDEEPPTDNDEEPPQVSELEVIKRPVVDGSQPNQPTCETKFLETNDSVETSDVFIEVNHGENSLDRELLSEEAGTAGALSGEKLSPSDSLPEENVSYMTGKKLMDSTDGNGYAMNKLVGSSSGEAAHNINDSDGKYSLTRSRPKSLLNSDASHPEDMFQAALDDNVFLTENVRKVSANDFITKADESVQKKSGDISIRTEKPTSKPSFMDEEEKHEDMGGRLEEEMMFLDRERDELGNEQRKLERNAESVSSEMFVECQELLQMFGLPYIIAPMEAEAQCAFMELSNLVDGVVTDDSDAFLFGARSVYKNIFDDRKYVETYLMKDIENELGLDREKLLHMALLLGSDYTEGVSGIGIVNAIEVVNAFPDKDGLREFREWIESPDPTILGKLDVQGGNSKRKGSKGGEVVISSSSSNFDGISCDQSVPQSEDETPRRKQIFMDKHRNVSKNWHIPSSFPSDAVISAYASPQVDRSTESFSWGKPDLSVLRRLCWEKFGWGTSKADDLLLPVLKEYNKHETQLRLEAFYTFNERFAKIRSKRIQKALKGITGVKSTELMDATLPHQSGSRKKRKGNLSEDEASQSGVSPTGLKSTDNSNQTSTEVNPTPKQLKGKRTKQKTPLIISEDCSNASTSLNTRKDSRVRGLRGRGRGRGQVHGRGRVEKYSSSEDTETSHERDSAIGDVLEPHQVRKSERVRNTVNYNEFDDMDMETGKHTDEGATANDSFGAEAVHVEPTHGTHIELEGGLFVDETGQTYSTNETNTSLTEGSLIDDHFNQSKLSIDYLQSGGGFCVEEDEQNENGPSRESVPENSSELHNADNETNLPIITPLVNDEAQIDDHWLEDDDENESGIGHAKSLRAMPNLRKKKRRQT